MIDPLPSDQFRVGDVLNNTYEIEGVLGRGGTGEVYRGRNQVTGRVLAIKVLSAQFSGNADFIELMKREEEMRSISNDAVVRYTECSRAEGGQVFLVMDFVDGPSLGDLMIAERLDPHDLLIVAHRVAEGLVATHARGIVHRDLSPDNIILRDGRPEAATIIDFGIAKDTAAGARTLVGNQFAGKYEYAAPEQVEGRAEARSDLYGLGATLLAAWRGETPFAGATPGEIVRRKTAPLDLSGVPEPLAGLIGWLAAPEPSDRPADASAALARIGELLGPARGGPARPDSRAEVGAGGRRRRWWPALVAAAAVAAAAAAYLGGLLDPLLPPALPVAEPYSLTASAGPDGGGTLVADAPDEAAGRALADAYAAAAGAPPTAPAIRLARGMPTQDWAGQAAALMRAFEGLEAWALALQDLSLQANGVAPDARQSEVIAGRIEEAAATAGMSATVSIRAGPLRLPAAAVAAALKDLANCGPLSQSPPESGIYGIDDTVRVTGAVAVGTDEQALRSRLAVVVGDRPLEFEPSRFDAPICTVRRALPEVEPGAMSIWLGNGATGSPNLGGVFRTGENPVAEVQVPVDGLEGYLWVMVVESSGVAFNLLPSEDQPENRLSELGVVEGGVRRIRVLWSRSEIVENPGRLGFEIDSENYGKSEILAILTRTRVFPARRPPKESAESIAEDLTRAFAEDGGEAIAVATRIIDARP